MEDFSSIITIVVFVAWGAISYLNSRQKQAAKEHKPTEEAWPTATPAPTSPHPAQAAQPAQAESRQQPRPAQEAPHRTATAQTTARQQHKSDGRRSTANAAQRNLGRGAAGAASTLASPVDPAEIDCETPQEPAQEFNLRQAVIYAEILKPKFEETE